MTQKSKLVTPDVVFNILTAKLSSLATSFVTNAGVALVEGHLMVESYKLSPVLHVQHSSVQSWSKTLSKRSCVGPRLLWNVLLSHGWIFLVNEYKSRTQKPVASNGLQPPEITDLHTDTEQRIVELLTKVLRHHHPLDIPSFRAFASFEPKGVSSDYLEQEAYKGRRAFIQALWTLYAKFNLYRLAYKAWKRHGPQNLATWTLLDQAVLDGCYAEKWPDTMFQVPDVCSICLSPMHWPEKTHCGHVFHL
ncbi:hypothetical protein TNCV_1555361 [Trichonephila clavipes]|nr:hypothetical protein TNCV_1555361 [Trichonephila clavipes]